MKHNAQCDEMKARVDAFWTKHPNACHYCGGAGGRHRAGTLYEPPSYDLCSCVEDGRCPLCSEGLETFEVKESLWSRCTVCSWDEYRIQAKEQEAEICPDFECFCWEDPALNNSNA